MKPTTFWGKLQRDPAGEISAWHPLVDHCADVAAVAEALLSLPLWRRRFHRLAGVSLTPTQVARLFVLVALHDLGKFNIAFQAKGRLDLGLGLTGGHVTAGAAAVLCWRAAGAVLADLESWGPSTIDLLLTAVYHHGRPFARHEAKAAWQRTWWQPRGGLDPEAGLQDLVSRCRQWFPAAFAPGGDAMPESPAFAHAFAGLVMLADWIGSDKRFFPFSQGNDAERMPCARERAREALEGLGFDLPLAHRIDTMGRNAFSRIAPAGYEPRPAQAAMLSLTTDAGGSIAALEAETGSGKTEAALAFFISLFADGLVDGLYFALPTRSAATQIHARIVDAVQRAFGDPPSVVLAVPGYLRVDEMEGKRLAPFEVQWPDNEADRLRYRTWAAENSKRYLAGTIVVGTIDQVLLSSLMVNHAHLRATSLLRHLLVVDEVHASDAYMGRILEDVLARHRSAGGHALLLSATLGGEARARLLAAGGASFHAPSLPEAEAVPYPLVTQAGATFLSTAISSDGQSRSIRLTPQPWLETPDAIATAAVDAARLGAAVLIIRNTVTDCVATQQAVEREAMRHQRQDLLFACHGVPAPHHSRFAKVDREALDRALGERLGRTRPNGGCIIVATQTVQQSLDIDADFELTDLCPADVLLQRLGRLHRHARTRPLGFEQPHVIILVPQNRDLGLLIRERGTARFHHGLGSVYPDLRILEATWRLIERYPTWHIPTMNRLLVERSLHSTVLKDIVHEHGGLWIKHAEEVLGVVYGHKSLATRNLVDWARPYDAISFPSTDEHIATRLGEDDRLVRLDPAVPGPFRHEVAELTLRHDWAANAERDACATKISTSQLPVESAIRTAAGSEHVMKIVRFEFGGKAFVYDRWGLRPDVSAADDVKDDDGP